MITLRMLAALAANARPCALGGALACTAVLAPAPGWADFGPRFQVAGPVGLIGSNSEPRVAIDANGDTVFAWEQELSDDGGPWRVQARRRSSAGVFGPVLNLTGPSTRLPEPRLAIDAGGNALITWNFRTEAGIDHAQFRAVSASGELGPITNLSNVLPVTNPRVAMTSQGKAIFVWERPNQNQGTRSIQSRARSATGALGPVQNISLTGQVNLSAEVAVNARGDAVFVWSRLIGSSAVLQARRRSATGELGLLRQNLGSGGGTTVAIAADGDAVITWIEPSTSVQRAVMRTFSAADQLGPRQAVSQGTGRTDGVQIAMNAAGNAVFALNQLDGESRFRVKTRSRSAAGVLTATQTLSAQDALSLFSTAVGVDRDSRSLFVWLRRNPDSGVFDRIEARTRSAIGDLGAVRVLSSPSAAFVAVPTLAMNARGQAAIAWYETDDEGITRMFGATFAPDP